MECAKDSLRVDFKTEKEFEGHVYVKGHYDEGECRSDATLTQHVNLTVAFNSCDVRRERSVICFPFCIAELCTLRVPSGQTKAAPFYITQIPICRSMRATV